MRSKGYGQFCPVAKACEVVAERWTPLVLRELMAGSHHFSQLHRGVRNMSRTLLVKRLRELEDAGIVHSEDKANGHGREYRLTESGEELREVVMLLGTWGQRWAQRQVDKADLDAELLMVDIQRRVDEPSLPREATVVRFDFSELPRYPSRPKTWWLVLDRREVDLCHRHPGLPVTLVVNAQLRAFSEVWIGRRALADTIREGLVSIEGPKPLVRALPSWLKLSPFAGVRPAP